MTQAFEEQLALIRELQEIDLTLHNLQVKLDDLPNQLKGVEEAYLTKKSELDASRTELDELEAVKRDDESELAASVDHLRTREAKLYAIKTNKEYQAALKEISEGRRINKEREDRILAAMEKIEALTQKTTQLNSECADKESAYKTKLDEVKMLEFEIKRQMENASAHRPEIVSRIEKVVIRKYDFVRQRYARALAVVSGGICEGCSRRIPPQLYNEMLRKEELKNCPNCQRLIYVEETSSSPKQEG